MHTNEGKTQWRSFLSGDDKSYEQLYLGYVQILYRYGRRFTSDEEIVKDCVQDVYHRLYKDRLTLPVPEDVRLYLIIALRNSLLRRLQRESKYCHIEGELPFSPEPDAEEVYIDRERTRIMDCELRGFLALLSPRQKKIIRLRYIHDLDFDVICRLMDLNYQSARNLLQRALDKMRVNSPGKKKTRGVSTKSLLMCSNIKI
jgi:RNA polymerase sigma factor (sigma-70 family)